MMKKEKIHRYVFHDRKDHDGLRIQRDVHVDYRRLARFSCRKPSPEEIDLLIVAGCVHYADRMTRRGAAPNWGRHLQISIPVHDPTRWNDSDVKGRLEQALQFVSGDVWNLEFALRSFPDNSLTQGFLPQGQTPSGKPVVIAYSGGLDSYAGVRLLRKLNPDLVPYLVRTQVQGSILSEDSHQDLPEHTRVPVLVGLRFPDSKSVKEPSSRTRTFMYLSIAAVAASMLGASTIAICENGQGSLGPSLVPDAWETPFRATHPQFSRALQDSFSKVLGTPLQFEHPFLWKTKGEVLRELSPQELKTAVSKTRSCAQYPMKWKGISPAFPCGICGGCILRRVSLIGSGHKVAENSEHFFWQNLSAATLSASSARVHTDERDERVAIRSVLDMDRLAQLSLEPSASPAYRRLVFELSDSLKMPEDVLVMNLNHLLKKHAEEWHEFLQHVGSTSWIADLLKLS